MNLETVDTILDEFPEILEDREYEDVVREDYSGRGMYGEITNGVVVDRYSFSEIKKFLDEKDISYRTDNMGLSFIIY